MRLAAYCRYSSDNQRDLSIVAQLRAIQDYAAREGHSVVKTYKDEARSATTDDRPEFLDMMRDVPSGLFDAIIVHKLDRFARDRYDAAYYRKTMKRHGVKLLSVVENLDDSPESVMFEAIIEGMNEYYSRNLSREVMKGMKETAYQCKHTGGMPPLGYEVAPDKTYIINEHEAEAVRMIYDMYTAGEGYSAIMEALAAKGYKTKTGQPFAKNSLNSILINEKYTGTFTFNKYLRKVDGRRNSRKTKPDAEIIRIEDGMPQIIDRATWNAVRAKMESNKHRQSAYRAKRVYLLSGKIFCGTCGGAMAGTTANTGRNKEPYSYYECTARKRKRTDCNMKAIGQEYIEEKVIEALRRNLFDPDVIDVATDQLYAYATKRNEDAPDKMKSIRASLASIDIEIRNIVNAIAAGMFHESMKDKMTDLEIRKGSLQGELSEMESKIAESTLSRDEIRIFLGRWTTVTDPSEYKQAVKLFVERVTVYDDVVDIDILTTCRSDRSSDTSRRGSPPPMCPKFRMTIRISITEYRHNAKKAANP